MTKVFAAIFIAAAAFLLIGGVGVSIAQAEEPMDRVEGTLTQPDKVKVRLADGTIYVADRAIKYLRENGYIVETGDQKKSYRTTEKYEVWKGTPRLQYVDENLEEPFRLQKVYLSNGQILTDSAGEYLVRYGYMEETSPGSGKFQFTAKYQTLKKNRGKLWGDVLELSGENIFASAEFRSKYPEIVVTAPEVRVHFRVERSDRDQARKKLEIEPNPITIKYAWYYYCKHSNKPMEHTEGCKVNTTASTCDFLNGDYAPESLAQYPSGLGGAWGATFSCKIEMTVDGKKQPQGPALATFLYEQYMAQEKAFLFRIQSVQNAEWLLK